MAHSPDSSISYGFPDTPAATTPGAHIKNESHHTSPDTASMDPLSPPETLGHGRRASKKPRSIASMTQDQRDRKRENGKMSSLLTRHPLPLIPCLPSAHGHACLFPALARHAPRSPLELPWIHRALEYNVSPLTCSLWPLRPASRYIQADNTLLTRPTMQIGWPSAQSEKRLSIGLRISRPS